jgi:predicted GIY-YIG superfamily endonuclease
MHNVYIIQSVDHPEHFYTGYTNDVEQRLEHPKTVCRQAGSKVTHQRLEIFRQMARTGDHPNAEQVFQGGRKRLPTISLDTVYRNLWFLVDLGLITTMSSGRKRIRFDADLDQHHILSVPAVASYGISTGMSSMRSNHLKRSLLMEPPKQPRWRFMAFAKNVIVVNIANEEKRN